MLKKIIFSRDIEYYNNLILTTQILSKERPSNRLLPSHIAKNNNIECHLKNKWHTGEKLFLGLSLSICYPLGVFLYDKKKQHYLEGKHVIICLSMRYFFFVAALP